MHDLGSCQHRRDLSVGEKLLVDRCRRRAVAVVEHLRPAALAILEVETRWSLAVEVYGTDVDAPASQVGNDILTERVSPHPGHPGRRNSQGRKTAGHVALGTADRSAQEVRLRQVLALSALQHDQSLTDAGDAR